MLLDTHTLLWWLSDDPKLSRRAAREIKSSGEVLVSAATGWEIATKYRVGKLRLKSWVPGDLPSILERANIEVLGVSMPHAVQAGMLPEHHRDPFDRLLVAQSLMEGIPIVTGDPAFNSYGVEVIW